MISKKTTKQLKKEADRALQEWGRRQEEDCEICGGEYQCMHHFFPKSISLRLRYHVRNLIFICKSCHFKHHTSYDPIIHMKVLDKRGDVWLKFLLLEKYANGGLINLGKQELLDIIKWFKNN